MTATKQDIELFKKKFKEWRSDWNIFIKEVLRVNLDTEMQEIVTCIQHNRKVSVCSGVSRGKDFLAATVSLCFLYLSPYWDKDGIFHSATVINTAPTDRQAKQIMMREIASRYNGSILPELSKFGFNTGRLVADGIKFDMPKSLSGKKEYAAISKWYHSAFKASNDTPAAWQGIHNDNIMICITEASGINSAIYDSVGGCLQGNSRLLLVHNPDVASGEAFNSMRDPQYKSFRLSSLTSPNVILGQKLKDGEITEYEYEDQKIHGQVDWDWLDSYIHKAGWTIKIRKEEFDPTKHDFEFNHEYFRPSDVARIKILAIHPESDSDSLIPLSWIEAAMERWDPSKKPEIKGIRGVDVAGLGVDTSIFADRYGDFVDQLTAPTCADPNLVTMDLAGKIKLEADKFDFIPIDAIGIGAGVFSRLKEQGMNNVYCFKNSYGAKGLRDKTEVRKFLNMRSYTHWALRDFLDPSFGSESMLPPDDELKAQLTEIKYKIRSDGQIQIEDKDEIKKRLGVSPDKADALAQTFAPKERLIAAIEKKYNRVRPGRFGG